MANRRFELVAAGLGRAELGVAIGSPANERQAIIAAMDFLLKGF